MRHPFLTGYSLGNRLKRELTLRELEEKFPDLSCDDIDRIEQGMLDGIVGDEFRKNLILEFWNFGMKKEYKNGQI